MSVSPPPCHGKEPVVTGHGGHAATSYNAGAVVTAASANVADEDMYTIVPIEELAAVVVELQQAAMEADADAAGVQSGFVWNGPHRVCQSG